MLNRATSPPVTHPLQSGLMRRRSAFRNWLEYGLALIVVKSLEIAPLAAAHRLAHSYARLLDLAIPRLRRTAEYNLELARPGENPGPIVDGVFRSIARLLLTLARFPSIG